MPELDFVSSLPPELAALLQDPLDPEALTPLATHPLRPSLRLDRWEGNIYVTIGIAAGGPYAGKALILDSDAHWQLFTHEGSQYLVPRKKAQAPYA